MPNIEIQPATFHFTNSPFQSPGHGESHDTSPLSGAVDQPVSPTNPADSLLETLTASAERETSDELMAAVPVEDESELTDPSIESKVVPPTPAPEDLPADSPPSDQAAALPRHNTRLLESPEVACEIENAHNLDVESSPVARRSSRQRRPPSRFQYATLGNPLISVVQSLFHGVVEAYSNALKTVAVADLKRPRVYTV